MEFTGHGKCEQVRGECGGGPAGIYVVRLIPDLIQNCVPDLYQSLLPYDAGNLDENGDFQGG